MVAPFPWFGGKRRVAPLVWRHFGDVVNYVEPFFGSGAVLLARPEPWHGSETINDADGFVANFWRALQHDPEHVARYADWPVNENDQHARHVWLVGERETLTARLEGDPEFYDAKIAGWWVWGVGCWIGAGWCSGAGPWRSVDGKLVHLGDAGRGVHRQRVHLGDAGQGVHRKLVHLGDAGQGVHRKRVHLGDAGQGEDGLLAWFGTLADRLRRVRVCCGDWERVCGHTPTVKQGLTGVLLDPPYADTATRTDGLYATDSLSVAHDVRRWAVEHGDDPRLRIALCGYDGEHAMPADWTPVPWKAHGGYGSQGNGAGRENAQREVVWFSPHCLSDKRQQCQQTFDLLAAGA
jgi:DNA adenine methylase